jgi:hypothetical protein
MNCGYTIIQNGRHFPCGQCMPCRINHKRMWTGRIVLEAAHSPIASSFVTLTYNDAHLPKNGSLDLSGLQRYIKRLRKASLGAIRYFAVGEYGDKTKRPHYHLALFNVPPEEEAKIQDKWGDNGFVMVGDITPQSAAYIAGYCTKKMTSHADPRLDGLYPEFALMSKHPPIGAAGLNHLEDLLHTKSGAKALEKKKDVPSAFQYGDTTYPIGRYFKDELRKRLGITEWPQNSTWKLDYAEFLEEQENAERVAVKLWRQAKNRSNRTL